MACPRCMENNGLCKICEEGFMDRPKFKAGDKVLVLNKKVAIIKEYIEDACGGGCCGGYALVDDGEYDVVCWEGQLEILSHF